MPNNGPCGRVVYAGEACFSVEGRAFCPDCFSAPTDGSIPFTEGMLPVDGRCGQMLEPPPPAEPSPLDPPLEVSPLPQPAAQADTRLADYAAYVEEVVRSAAGDNVPLLYEDWQKGEALKRATAALAVMSVEAKNLTEVVDEAVQMIIRLVEAAYLLGQNATDDDA